MKIMEHTLFKCPICNADIADPIKLREHRLTAHKNVFDEITVRV
jgi:hypothetical protein